MNTILEALYKSQLFPCETLTPQNLEYRRLNQKITNFAATLQNKLSDADYQLMEEFLDLYHESSAMEATHSFIHGFKLGARMIVEVFSGREEPDSQSDPNQSFSSQSGISD
jgi:hypothetical protein